jgi:hypothetical protein
LLAEAECRSGNGANCVAAANNALAIDGNDAVALTWRGYGKTLGALSAPASERETRLTDARADIIKANRIDTESVVPLLAYYRTYALSGETPPGAAVDGLAKSLDEVPAAPTTRLMLGSALTKDEDLLDARRILLPVAEGPFDSPEKPQAKQLLSNITGKPVALNDVPRR